MKAVEYLQSRGSRNHYALVTEEQVINNVEMVLFSPVGT